MKRSKVFWPRGRRSSKRSKHHEWKRSQKERFTLNNREYKIWHKLIVDPLSCWYCAPHQGCNYHRDHRPYKSWKFRFRKRKQWIKTNTKIRTFRNL